MFIMYRFYDRYLMRFTTVCGLQSMHIAHRNIGFS